MTDSFQNCCECGKEIALTWSPQKAMAAMLEAWGDLPADHMEFICDDCYVKILKPIFPEIDSKRWYTSYNWPSEDYYQNFLRENQ